MSNKVFCVYCVYCVFELTKVHKVHKVHNIHSYTKLFLFGGDVGDVVARAVGKSMVVQRLARWTRSAAVYRASVTRVVSAGAGKGYTVQFGYPNPAAPLPFKTRTMPGPVRVGDTAVLHARPSGTVMEVVQATLKPIVGSKETNTPAPSQTPSEMPTDGATGFPTVGPFAPTFAPTFDATAAPVEMPASTSPTEAPTTSPGGLRINLTLDNDNENDNKGGANANADGDGGPYGGGYPYLLGATTAPDEETDVPDPEVPDADPPPPTAPDGSTTLRCPAAAPGLKEGTYFCLTKKTFYLVLLMLLVACILGGVGYYMYRKRVAMGRGGPGNVGGGGGFGGGGGGGGGQSPDLSGLGDLGLDLGPGGR